MQQLEKEPASHQPSSHQPASHHLSQVHPGTTQTKKPNNQPTYQKLFHQLHQTLNGNGKHQHHHGKQTWCKHSSPVSQPRIRMPISQAKAGQSHPAGSVWPRNLSQTGKARPANSLHGPTRQANRQVGPSRPANKQIGATRQANKQVGPTKPANKQPGPSNPRKAQLGAMRPARTASQPKAISQPTKSAARP